MSYLEFLKKASPTTTMEPKHLPTLGPIQAPIGPVTAEGFDQIGAPVLVPKTGVNTVLISMTQAYAVIIDAILVTALEAAATDVMIWSLRQNGAYVFPWTQQPVAPDGPYHPIQIGRGFAPGTLIEIVAQVPATAPAAYNGTGRLIGRLIGGFK